jgi:hypothetical protein
MGRDGFSTQPPPLVVAPARCGRQTVPSVAWPSGETLRAVVRLRWQRIHARGLAVVTPAGNSRVLRGTSEMLESQACTKSGRRDHCLCGAQIVRLMQQKLVRDHQFGTPYGVDVLRGFCKLVQDNQKLVQDHQFGTPYGVDVLRVFCTAVTLRLLGLLACFSDRRQSAQSSACSDVQRSTLTTRCWS